MTLQDCIPVDIFTDLDTHIGKATFHWFTDEGNPKWGGRLNDRTFGNEVVKVGEAVILDFMGVKGYGQWHKKEQDWVQFTGHGESPWNLQK